MAAFGTYLENAGLNHFLNVTPLAQAPLNLHLYLTDPTDDDTGTEVSGGSYAPVAATFNPAAAGATDNDVAIVFTEATGSWGNIAYFALKDGADNLYYHGQFDVAKTIDTGDVAAVAIGDLNVSHD